MEIDNHILSLSMEFERYNIIINEHEMHKAKTIHDRSFGRKLRKSASSTKKSAKTRQTSEQARILQVENGTFSTILALKMSG